MRGVVQLFARWPWPLSCFLQGRTVVWFLETTPWVLNRKGFGPGGCSATEFPTVFESVSTAKASAPSSGDRLGVPAEAAASAKAIAPSPGDRLGVHAEATQTVGEEPKTVSPEVSVDSEGDADIVCLGDDEHL